MINASMSLIGHQTCVSVVISDVSPITPGSCGSPTLTQQLALRDPLWEKGADDPIPRQLGFCMELFFDSAVTDCIDAS